MTFFKPFVEKDDSKPWFLSYLVEMNHAHNLIKDMEYYGLVSYV